MVDLCIDRAGEWRLVYCNVFCSKMTTVVNAFLYNSTLNLTIKIVLGRGFNNNNKQKIYLIGMQLSVAGFPN